MIRIFSGDADEITTPGGHAMELRLLDLVRSLVAELLRHRTQPPVTLVAAPGPVAGLRFDAEGRLACTLGPHLLCHLPVSVEAQAPQHDTLAA